MAMATLAAEEPPGLQGRRISSRSLRLLAAAASVDSIHRSQIQGTLWILRRRRQIQERLMKGGRERNDLELPSLVTRQDTIGPIQQHQGLNRGAETWRAAFFSCGTSTRTGSPFENENCCSPCSPLTLPCAASPGSCVSGPVLTAPQGTTTTTAGASSSSSSPRAFSPPCCPGDSSMSADKLSLSAASSSSPSRWWLRGTSVRRRFSGAACDFSFDFQRRVTSLWQRQSRRRSLSADDLRHAALQRKQYACLQEVNALTHRVSSPAYRRSLSAVSVNVVHEALQQARSFRIGNWDRQLNGEVWPESVTALLTGAQLLVDRQLLLSQLPPPSVLQQEDDGKPLRLLAGGCTLPRHDKLAGEDAYFVCPSELAIGVADGVGEWADLGCNAKDFANELMSGAARAARKQATEDVMGNVRAAAKALECVSAGYESTVSYGSSTCLVAYLDGLRRQLGLANLGDSTGLVLRREGSLLRVFMTLRRTREQQHFFNCPYQLSRVPRLEEVGDLERQGFGGLAKAISGMESRLEGDTPDMADLYDVKVQPGDLIILGTDGVFDNLFDQEISSLVSLTISPAEAKILDPFLESAKTGIAEHPNASVPPKKYPNYGIATPPQHIAKALAGAAFHRSQDPRARTPFGRQSRRHGSVFSGGKLDDITVVAAWVV